MAVVSPFPQMSSAMQSLGIDPKIAQQTQDELDEIKRKKKLLSAGQVPNLGSMSAASALGIGY